MNETTNNSTSETEFTDGQVPHAVRVRWINSETWQQEEMTVLAEGYMQQIEGRWYDCSGVDITDNPNLKQPTVFEVLETQGATTYLQAFRAGHYFLVNERMRQR